MLIKLYPSQIHPLGVQSNNKLIRALKLAHVRQNKIFPVKVNEYTFDQDEHGIHICIDTPVLLEFDPGRNEDLHMWRVSLFKRGHGPHPSYGQYESGDILAQATVDSANNPNFPMWEMLVEGETYEGVIKLYKQIRSGEIDPTVTWEKPL